MKCDLLDLIEVTVCERRCGEEKELELAKTVQRAVCCVRINDAGYLWVELEEAAVCSSCKALLAVNESDRVGTTYAVECTLSSYADGER